jgi:glyoxylase-like metal-dependent hydrolase (beta-lactamase superfamily II)
MSKWQYTKGLHDLGNGCHAYLQPEGSWGWSNAGLISDGGETLLVDTLMDVRLTRDMLDVMRKAVPDAARIGTLINTHANPDHTFGNQLLQGATIIASAACAEEMPHTPPQMLAAMQKNWRVMGEGAAFFYETMGKNFNFDEVVLTLPNKTFDKELTLRVGGKEVQLVNVGPAHTAGDTMVHVPQDRTVFTGDVLFIGGHPVMWAGPIDNWIRACDIILGWDVETIVPGHGPITDKAGVRKFKTYLEDMKREARKRFDAGMGWIEAANDIALEGYADWIDGERIVANVAALYREFSGGKEQRNIAEVFAAMRRYLQARAR